MLRKRDEVAGAGAEGRRESEAEAEDRRASEAEGVPLTGVAYAKPSLDISYSDDHFLVLVTFAIYNCFQICTNEAPI